MVRRTHNVLLYAILSSSISNCPPRLTGLVVAISVQLKFGGHPISPSYRATLIPYYHLDAWITIHCHCLLLALSTLVDTLTNMEDLYFRYLPTHNALLHISFLPQGPVPVLHYTTPFPFTIRQTRGLLARTPVIFRRL